MVAAQDPERHADEHGEGRGAEAGQQRYPGAPDEAAQHVAAELVGAEGVTGRERRPEAGLGVHRVGVGQG